MSDQLSEKGAIASIPPMNAIKPLIPHYLRDKDYVQTFTKYLKCKLLSQHKFAIYGKDWSKKYGQYANPDRICLRCNKKEVWFSQFGGRNIYQDENTQELNF